MLCSLQVYQLSLDPHIIRFYIRASLVCPRGFGSLDARVEHNNNLGAPTPKEFFQKPQYNNLYNIDIFKLNMGIQNNDVYMTNKLRAISYVLMTFLTIVYGNSHMESCGKKSCTFEREFGAFSSFFFFFPRIITLSLTSFLNDMHHLHTTFWIFLVFITFGNL